MKETIRTFLVEYVDRKSHRVTEVRRTDGHYSRSSYAVLDLCELEDLRTAIDRYLRSVDDEDE